MHPTTRRLLLFLLAISALVGVALAPVALAQVPPGGIGVCRSKGCPCTKDQLQQGWQQTSKGCCNQAQLDALRGRIRGLKEAADAHRKGLQEALEKRNNARDRLWGKGEGTSFEGGSISSFGNSALGVLTAPERTNDLYGWISTGISVASDPKSSEEWAGVGVQYLSTDAFLESGFLSKSARDAAQRAAKYTADTGDTIGAGALYKSGLEESSKLESSTLFKADYVNQAANWLGAIQAVWSLAESTDALTTDLSDYYLANQDVNAIQIELDKIDGQIDALLKQIAALEKQCDSASSPKSGMWLPDMHAAWGVGATSTSRLRAVSLHTDDVAAMRLPAPRMSAQEAARIRTTLKDLKRLSLNIKAIQKRFLDRLLIPLSPWPTGAWKSMPPRLLIQIARDALPHLKNLQHQLSSTATVVEKIRTELKDLSSNQRRLTG